jgi:hypothetical protein
MALFSIPEERPSGAQIAGRAWGSVFGAINQMPALAISALIALMVLTIGLTSLRFLISVGGVNLHAPILVAVFGFGLLQSVLSACATSMIAAPVAVAVHRFILLGEVARGAFRYGRSEPLRSFFGWRVCTSS